MGSDLGILKKVIIRKKWPDEASDFTPWLAKEENIEKLSLALGLELQVENTEVSVGPYSADILAKDAGTDRYVVIENQLKRTNHDHLGKLITYGSVLDASAVVWIASDFTEEHKKALDWLNDHTSDEISFYGVILELWQIDDSKPAVRFNVLSKPADIMRQTAITKASENLTDTKRLQLEFWTRFREKLSKRKEIPSVQSARPQYWFDVSLGRSGINLSNTANTSDNKIGVRVYIGNKVASVALPQLLQMKEEIEAEIGEKLEWDPNPENLDKTIGLKRDADLTKRESWEEYLDWLTDMTIKFRKTFSKRVKSLDLTKKVDEEHGVEET
ncbi:MAG: hypothetical protein MOIL_01054 [Candidatus Methanolliviera sp. GoM_oil]|nr:MAG: hypothetical protein MOIL_01054 [Candidatus Methanolliviera sp. GoM_oil]